MQVLMYFEKEEKKISSNENEKNHVVWVEC
jgi:hypothetical protein